MGDQCCDEYFPMSSSEEEDIPSKGLEGSHNLAKKAKTEIAPVSVNVEVISKEDGSSEKDGQSGVGSKAKERPQAAGQPRPPATSQSSVKERYAEDDKHEMCLTDMFLSC